MNYNFLVRLLSIYLVVIVTMPSCFAQTQPESPRFRCLSWNGTIQDLFYTQSDLPAAPDPNQPSPEPDPNFKEVRLVIPSSFRSSFYDFEKDKPLKIIRHEGQKIALLGTLDLSNGPDLPLLFFTAGPTKGSYDIHVIDDSGDKFPGGSFLCYNFSKVEVSPSFNNSVTQTTTPIAPAQSALLSPKFKPFETTWLTVKVPHFADPVYSAAWTIRQDQRFLVFFIDDPTTPGSVNFLRVSDSIRQLARPTPAP